MDLEQSVDFGSSLNDSEGFRDADDVSYFYDDPLRVVRGDRRYEVSKSESDLPGSDDSETESFR